jgi:hypothetical protein
MRAGRSVGSAFASLLTILLIGLAVILTSLSGAGRAPTTTVTDGAMSAGHRSALSLDANEAQRLGRVLSQPGTGVATRQAQPPTAPRSTSFNPDWVDFAPRVHVDASTGVGYVASVVSGRLSGRGMASPGRSPPAA